MRKIILTAISILSLVIMVSTNSAAAEERRIIFEMGESGQTVSFPMTSEEISDHVVDFERLVQIGLSISKTITQRFTAYEMGESGQTFSFPMTSEEISVDDAAKPLLSDIRKKSTVDEWQPGAYEMAESGELIEFFEPAFENETVTLARKEQR